jgi:peptidoglycan/LPS O-acetylase OafA/YrhL
MHGWSLNVAFAIGLSFWLLACALLYKRNRAAAWLAGSSVARCLFLLGVAATSTAFVRGTLVLVPLWVGVFALAALHLHAARRHVYPVHTTAATGHTTDPTPPQGFYI